MAEVFNIFQAKVPQTDGEVEQGPPILRSLICHLLFLSFTLFRREHKRDLIGWCLRCRIRMKGAVSEPVPSLRAAEKLNVCVAH
uniref:Glutathione peroxidase 7 n=1 Tax=Gasterosteus aculeatus TaxID=69293 RepID=G3NNN1_GASAC